MFTAPAEPLRFEPQQAHDHNEYLLHAQGEIVFVLRSVMNKGLMLTAYFNEGNDFLLTTLLALDDDEIVFECGASDEMNRKALTADKLIFVTSLDKVKVQFSTSGIVSGEHMGRPALRAALPRAVLRLQRREYYRLVAPVLHPLRCEIPIPMPDETMRKVALQVIDISGGGIALMAPASDIPFDVDMEFDGCRLDLPEIGTVRSRLRVRNRFDITLRNGVHAKRCGCQFIGLQRQMQAMVERYIMRVERERKARGSGLA